jgi:thioredoxin 1
MQRRTFLALAAASPLLARPLAAEELAYTPGLVDAQLAAGKTLFVDFYATWCTTCAAQQRILADLKAANPAYAQALTFVTVDWDTYSRDELTRRLAIPRRSTLVVLKGDAELGRIVAGTDPDEIRALLDTALAAATAA